MKKMSKAEIKLLSQDLLKIDRPSFAIYLSELEVKFRPESGYYYNRIYTKAIFDK